MMSASPRTSFSATSTLRRFAKVFAGTLALVALAFSLTACAGQSPEESAKAALNNYLSQIQNGDVEQEMGNLETEFESLGGTAEDGKAYIEAWLDGFSYQIGSVTMDGDDHCNIEVTLTCRDLATALSNGITRALSEAFSNAFAGASQEEIQRQTIQILIDEVNASEPVSTEITVPMELNDKEWEPTITGETTILNAMIGDVANLQRTISSLS